MERQIELADFQKVDLRVGLVLGAEDFPLARKPSYLLTIDFGPLGTRRSVAALKRDYSLAELAGRQVVCVFNFPARRIAGFASEVLVLAATEADGTLRLLAPDPGATPGSFIS